MTAFERVERRTRAVTDTVWRADGDATTTTTDTTVTTHYTVTGVEAVSLYADSPSGRLYEPVSVRIEHTPGRPKTASLSVNGRLRRKNGTLSDNVQHLHRYGWSRKEWPAWLAEIVADALGVNP